VDDKTGRQTARYIQLNQNERVDFRHALNLEALCWFTGDTTSQIGDDAIIIEPDEVEDAPESLRMNRSKGGWM
jgi:hypothetical protein